jgi:hypothetical protein
MGARYTASVRIPPTVQACDPATHIRKGHSLVTYRTEFFPTYDGLRLAYHVIGSGRPLIVLPTGPD